MGVVLFFNNINILLLNLILDPSFFLKYFLVLIIIPFNLAFFFIQFDDFVFLTDTFIKSPKNAVFLLNPLYK